MKFLACLLLASSIFAADDYEVVHGWPKVPEGFVLSQVAGVGVDSHDNVLIFRRADHSWLGGVSASSKPIHVAPVMIFDGKTGVLLGSWGEDSFLMPHGLTVDADDNVWLTDVGLHQVFKYTHDGRLLMTLGEKGRPGTDTKHFNKPTDVAIATDGSFYVSDGYGNSRVMKFAKDGKFLLQWGTRGGKDGQFHLPHGLAIDPQGRVYVADRGNARVQAFDPDGRWLATWKSEKLGRPWALARAQDGSFFVVDGGDQPGNPIANVPDRARILHCDDQGNVLASFGSFGNYDGQFVWPHDIAVAKDGSVYVADVATGMRVQKFVPKR